MRPIAAVSTAAEQEAGHRQRQQRVDVGAADGRQRRRRQPLRAPRRAAPRRARRDRSTARRDDAADDDEQRDRPVLQEPSSRASSTASAAQPERRATCGFVSPRSRKKWPDALPEVAAVAAAEAEQLGQLRARQEQRHAALEADHHRLGDEVDDGPGADGPRGERDAARPSAPCTRPARRDARGRRRRSRRATRRSAARSRT